MRKLRLSKGLFCLVDDADFDFLNQWKWTVSQESGGQNKWYVVRYVHNEKTGKTNKKVRIHRVLMGLDDSDPRVVDHIDGDSLDNRRENLEVTTRVENARRGNAQRKLRNLIAKQNPAREPDIKKPKRKKVRKKPRRVNKRKVQQSKLFAAHDEGTL